MMEFILSHVEKGVMTLTLNRPERLNSFNDEMHAQPGDAGGKVNLTTATKEELMTLAGIGESKADSIIKYREEHGKFQSIEDIKQIEGIKDGVFQKIKDLITV